MGANRSTYLLAALLGLIASHGMSPETLDPWRGWVTFKQFVRQVNDEPDQGISVQMIPTGDRGPIRLAFVRQVLQRVDDRMEPVGGVVCDFWFEARRQTPPSWEAWSFDSPTFERFVDLVEQHPLINELMVTRPLSSDVYWQEA
jgi:hypothetical protein